MLDSSQVLIRFPIPELHIIRDRRSRSAACLHAGRDSGLAMIDRAARRRSSNHFGDQRRLP
jgi:hypothetical protein